MTAIGSNALLQALSLILIARSLGPEEYAVIVAAAACGAVAAEFVGLGSGDLLIRDVSRSPDRHGHAFGRALSLLGLTIFPFCLMAALGAESWFGTSGSLLVMLALVSAEIIAIRFAWLGEQIAIAHHAIHTATVSRIFASTVRFAGVCIATLAAGISTAAQWSTYALLSSVALAVGCMAIAIQRFGGPVFRRTGRSDVGAGTYFSVMQIIRAAQFSLDKFAVASVAAPATVGAFGAASRVAQLGVMPASAVMRITYPTFFAKGAAGIGPVMTYARRLAVPVMGLGLTSSLALAGAAYLLPLLLGAEFADAKLYVLMLAPLPLASALQNLGGNLLSGSDFQAHRTWAMAAGLLLMGVACFVGARFAGVPGAIVGYVIGHFLFAAITWLVVLSVWQREQGEASVVP